MRLDVRSSHLSRVVPLLVILLLLFGVGSGAQAQQATARLPIAGRVTDEKGDGLPGVNVSVKGSTRGTTTNNEGRYQLTVPGSDAVLVFSFVGYDGQELTVGNRTTIDIVLKGGSQSLGDVLLMLAIPLREITLNPGLLQNPGY